MKHHAICIVCILFLIVIFIVAAYILEPMLLYTFQPSLPKDLTIDQWMDSFQTWAYVCVGAAVIAIILWYLFSQTVFKTIHEKPSGKRWLWGLLFFLPTCAVAISFYFIEETESEPLLAYLCFVVNGFLLYYLATLLFSPTSVKFTPLGSMKIRRFW